MSETRGISVASKPSPMMFMRDPQPSDGFEWTQAPWGPVLHSTALQPFATHFFTAATLRLRDDPDEWRQIAERAGVTEDRLRLLHQVHGSGIVTAASARGERPEADGIVSADPSVALVVRVADCAPLLVADKRNGAVAAVHAGWRSTMRRIAAEAVRTLAEKYGSRPEDLVVALGPSLGACCGEMGEEVVAAFQQAGHDSVSIDRWFSREPGRRPHFDLWRANTDQLEAVGVPSASIHVSGLCTRTHSQVFHSYRASGPAAGRMAAVIRANR
jgi:polyphenol oxidase